MTEVTTEVDLKAQVADLAKQVQSLLNEHAEFRSVHVSRRGVAGGRGEQGLPGPAGTTGAPGPAGRDGKDADISEAVKAAKKAIEDEYGFYLNADVLKELIVHQLKLGGVLDAEGRAILIPGPTGSAGRDGIDGKPGRDGVDGQSIVGPAGRDGRDGVDGQPGRDGIDGKDGVSNVPGPQGERGPEGERGLPGASGVTKADVVAIVQDMHRRGSI
jgi:hypothetical protein